MAYKKRFGQMQNLQKFIRTNAEITKVHSDKCRTYKSPFGQMHAPLSIYHASQITMQQLYYTETEMVINLLS